MTCVKCGATLRPTARFCNMCGARQPSGDAPSAAPSAPDAFAPAADSSPDANTRAKRPPRPVRSGSVAATGILTPLDAPEEVAFAAASTKTTAPVTTSADADEITAEAPVVRRTPAQTTPAGMVTPPVMAAFRAQESQPSASGSSPRAADTWADQETTEYYTILSANAPGSSSPHSSASSTGTPGGDKDPLPWPLPVGMIVNGRYRIEEALSSEGTGAEAVNVYRVVDLQGYEKCWACGAEYSAEELDRQFCDNCGADMLAREYRMTERRSVSGATADEADTQAEDASAYLAQIEQLRAEADVSGSAQHPEARVFTIGARFYRVTPKAEPAPPAFPFGAHVSAAGASDVGKSRMGSANEESFGTFTLNIAHESRIQPISLCLVADGLGGHANGQDASRLVTRVMLDYIVTNIGLPFTAPRGSTPPPDDGIASVLQEAVQAANAALYEANQQARADMGSTLVAALISGETAWIVNLGDSRCYAFDPARD